jgi:diguanylate cyclase
MSSLIAFLFAALNVCLGYALAAAQSRRNAAKQAARSRRVAPAALTISEMTTDEAAGFLKRIEQVTTEVDADVDRHASRVAAISGELSADAGPDSGLVVYAAERLLEANRTLQKDLADARAEISAQRGQLESYMTQALTDALTGLANRRGFDEELKRRFAHLHRGGPPLSLVLVDIDHFKKFNDDHGHLAGDFVLGQVADVLARTTRQMDFVARYGGEEFGVVLPGTTLNEAKHVAEQIRGAIEHEPIEYNGRGMKVTVSAGLAQAEVSDETAGVVGRADAALYAAKQAGRNQCQVHDGLRCHPIDREPTQLRRCESTQRIAPFADGHFPEPGMFRDIDCEQFSSTGFTYLVNEIPDYDKVLVALGESAACAYTTASVQECRNIGVDDMPLYRINCRFTAPVDRPHEEPSALNPA